MKIKKSQKPAGGEATYNQLGDILRKSKQFHQQLGDYYERCGKIAPDERLKLLLTNMAFHQKELVDGIAEYEQRKDNLRQGTYLQYDSTETMQPLLQEVRLDEHMTVEAVVEAGLRFDDALIKYYRRLADMTDYESVRDVFDTVAERIIENRSEMVAGASQLND